MRTSTHGRIAGLVALAMCGTGAAFAVTGSVDVLSPRTVEPRGEVYPPVDTDDRPASPGHDELGAVQSAPGRRSDGKRDRDDKRKRRTDGVDKAEGTPVLAALIPAGSGGGGPPLPCSDTSSCVNRVGRLVTDVADRLPDLPKLRECISSIGGEALCFDFGGGNYLVCDGPADGELEFGFCGGSGYYHVSGPSLGGGTGGACPGDRGGDDRARGDRPPRGEVPTRRECTSLRGGQATCFDFSDGSYIVSDSLADGEGELGFCGASGYYYVSAPSAEGGAGARCPGARAD